MNSSNRTAPAALLLLVSVTGCGWTERGCIERVLREDEAAGRNVKRVADAVDNMRSIDTSSCPADFREAYINHVHAWDKMKDVERAAEAPLSDDGGFIDALKKAGKSILVTAAGTEAQEEIKKTYKEVERVAAIHGATLPKADD